MRPTQLIRDLGKFGLVGVLNTTIGLVVFNSLLFLSNIRHGWMLGLITFVAYAVGITNSFFWNKWWVFRHGESGQGKRESVRFFVVSSVVALLCAGIVSVLTTYLHPAGLSPALWANVTLLLVFPISMFGNFFGLKLFVFVQEPA